MVDDRHIAARGERDSPHQRRRVRQLDRLPQRRDLPTQLAADGTARDVLDRRDGLAAFIERGFDEHERGLDVRFAGVERRQDTDLAGLHYGCPWPADSIAYEPLGDSRFEHKLGELGYSARE